MLCLAPAPARGGDLKDVVRDLYGGDGIRLGPPESVGGFSHAAHFTTQSLQGLDQLSAGVASGTGLFSFNSVVTGFTLDLETGVPVRTTDSLGPLLAETAHTLGANKLNLGFSFTHIRYTRFEGVPLNKLVLFFNHPDANHDGMLGPGPGDPPDFFDFERDRVRVDIDLEIQQDIYALFASYGLTPNWDVGVILPIIHATANANAVASIEDNSPFSNLHFFDPGVGDPPGDEMVSRIHRSSTGIGDLVVRTKYNLVRDQEKLPDMAIGGQIVFPTGDADNFQGTGETRLAAVFIVSKPLGRFTPHANVGYEVAPGDSELNSLRYIVGFDMVVIPSVTAAMDVLGRWQHNGDGIGDHTVDLAVGAKFNVYKTTLLNVNFLFPINRQDGLRADFIWTIGIEHTF